MAAPMASPIEIGAWVASNQLQAGWVGAVQPALAGLDEVSLWIPSTGEQGGQGS
jgi:hypothetical protein